MASPRENFSDYVRSMRNQHFTICQIFERAGFASHRRSDRVVSIQQRIKALRGVVPQRIQCDNGSEFISKALDKWPYDNQVTLEFSRPGKPTANPFIESFNGSFRDECLNVNWFLSLADAKEKIQLFKEDYNGFRPHSSLSGLTPNEVVQQHSNSPIFSILGR
jgi:putative transposase